jgi:hypothetical protein
MACCVMANERHLPGVLQDEWDPERSDITSGFTSAQLCFEMLVRAQAFARRKKLSQCSIGHRQIRKG